jgi:hypothetical protein
MTRPNSTDAEAPKASAVVVFLKNLGEWMRILLPRRSSPDFLPAQVLIGFLAAALIIAWAVVGAIWIELRPTVYAHAKASALVALGILVCAGAGGWRLAQYLRHRPEPFVSISPRRSEKPANAKDAEPPPRER